MRVAGSVCLGCSKQFAKAIISFKPQFYRKIKAAYITVKKSVLSMFLVETMRIVCDRSI